MFKRQNRFTFRRGIPNRTYNSKSFVLRYGLNDEILKVAVVVGKKVDKRATGRNRIKREIVKILEEILNKESKNSIIVFAKKQIIDLENESLKQELNDAFAKLKMT